LFIIFGSLCVLAALQAFTLYPETGRKSLEEIEQLFKKFVIYTYHTHSIDLLLTPDFGRGGPKPWHTRVGDSHLDAEIEEVIRRASVSQSEGGDKAQVLRKDGTIGTLESDDEEKKETV